MNILTSIRGRKFGISSDGSFVFNNGSVQHLLPGSKSVSVTAATVTISRDSHMGRLVIMNRAAGVVATLPAATGSQDEYEFMVGTTITSNSATIAVANASDTMTGYVSTGTTTAGAGLHEAASGTDDTISMNGTTTGGIAGSRVRVRDVATNLWLIDGRLVGSGSLGSSLSAAVS